MKKTAIGAIIIVMLLGGLFMAKAKHAPKATPPTTQEVWDKEGVPVEVDRVVLGDMEQSVEITGDINALDKMTLSAKVAGRVAGVYAREGDSVGRGMTVILLDQDDALAGLQEARGSLQAAQAQLSQTKTNSKVTRIQTDAGIEGAQANLDAALARLKVVKNPSRNQDVIIAENRVASAKADLDRAEADYNRHEKLLKAGAISKASYDVVKTQYSVAKANHDSAKQQLSLVKEGGRSEDIRAAEAQVAMAREQLRTAKANASQNLLRQEDIKAAEASVQRAKASVSLAEQRLSYTYIKSPISGQLASRLTEPGQVVAPGQALGDVVDLSSLYFKGDISETDMAKVKKGQQVRVTIDALKGEAFMGTVDEIYPSAMATSRSFPARIRISDTRGLVKPGMFARGDIVTEVNRSILLVPKDAVEDRQGTKMVFTVENGKAKRHEVVVLRENRDYAEIALPTGLKVGDTVVTAGRQNLQNGTRVAVGKKK